MTNDMTTRLPLPERETFEREIHELLDNGDISNIARYMQRDQSQVSKALNPYDDSRRNYVFEFLTFLWATDCIRDNLGDEVLSIVNRERSKWLCDGVEIIDAPSKLTGNIGREYAEAIESELIDAPIDMQINEFTHVRDAIDAKLGSLIYKRSGQFIPRKWAKEVVTNGNGKRSAK